MTDVFRGPLLAAWPALIFWAAIVGGVVVGGLGVGRHRPAWLLAGALLTLPPALYLTVTPRFGLVGLTPVACLLLAAGALRWDRPRWSRLLVGAAVVFWSAVASLGAMPILGHVLVTGTVVGLVVPRRQRRWTPGYVAAGTVGALGGALLSFGDAPVLMRHPVLNPRTLSLAGAVVLVTMLSVVERALARGARQ